MSNNTAKEDLLQSFAWIYDVLLREQARRQGEPWGQGIGDCPVPPVAAYLTDLFDLSPFEANLLLLLAAAQVDVRTHQVLTDLSENGDARVGFGLALEVLPDGHWSALSPCRPLRRWRLIAWDDAKPTLTAPLNIDERILLFLLGVSAMDALLMNVISPMRPAGDLPGSQVNIVDTMAQTAAIALRQGEASVLQLFGGDHATMEEIAAAFYQAGGLTPWRLSARALPEDPAQVTQLADLWRREVYLDGVGLVIDAYDLEPSGRASLEQFVERLDQQLVILSDDGRAWLRPSYSFEVSAPTIDEQVALWSPAFDATDDAAKQLAHNFTLEARNIRALVETIEADAEANESVQRPEAAWRACRAMAAPRAVSGVTVTAPTAALADLKLPSDQSQIIRQIIARARQGSRVFGDWGYSANGGRGVGVSALFIGASGTGKTLAAELIAAELNLDLHRVDISSVMSKYIGKTEKVLRRIFATAEAGGAVLLFDEADALFGKRGEVKDSHDRYSNIAVSYLLQQLETYRGLAILTTNLKDNIDSAFLRRFTYLVDFPYPDQSVRKDIWQGAFTPETPLGDLDFAVLSGIAASGAEIQNIAIRAAFLAASENSDVTMALVQRAAAAELEKAGR